MPGSNQLIPPGRLLFQKTGCCNDRRRGGSLKSPKSGFGNLITSIENNGYNDSMKTVDQNKLIEKFYKIK
jgi:hypothetical protein